MFEPFKISRVLPPHELNARRNRKRTANNLPALVHRQEPHPRNHQEHAQPNDQVFNLGDDPITHHE